MTPMRSLISAVLLALTLAACGGGGSETASDAGSSEPVDTSSAEAEEYASAQAEAAASAQAEADAADEARAQELYDSCSEPIDPFLTSLEDLNSRIAVGINVDTYSELVGATRIEYDRVVRVVDELTDLGDGECIDIASSLEDVLNIHTKVLDAWNDCISDFDCDFSEGEPAAQTQKRWAKALKDTDAAREDLEALAP